MSEWHITLAVNCLNVLTQCNFVYYGQAERSLKTQIAERKKAVAGLNQNSKVASHVHRFSHIMNFESIKVVGSKPITTSDFSSKPGTLLWTRRLGTIISYFQDWGPNCGAQKGSGRFWPKRQSCKPCPPFQPQHKLFNHQGRGFDANYVPRTSFPRSLALYFGPKGWERSYRTSRGLQRHRTSMNHMATRGSLTLRYFR